MRIEHVQITPVALGDPPLLNAGGVHAPYALRIILEVTTETGVRGISEIPGGREILDCLKRAASRLRGTSLLNLRAISDVLAAASIGGDTDARGDRPWDRRTLIHALSGLEVAGLDALGRQLSVRVVDLLGGAMRDRVPYAGYLFFKYDGRGGEAESDTAPASWLRARRAEALEADGLVAQARSLVESFGFSSLKVKGGILDPSVEVEATLALRDEFGPSMPLRIDPNASWRFETALEYGRRLKDTIEYYEDPVRGQEAMARLRRALDIPLATNMCTTAFSDLPSSLAQGSEDIILADHHFWGGLRASMDLARICQTFGRGLSMHSNSHAGVSLAAMTHLAAALPVLDYALDTHYPWQTDEVIAGGKLAFADGAVAVPDGPGLGVEIDSAALARLHGNYQACGLLDRDDEAEMRKRHPGWTFQPVRY